MALEFEQSGIKVWVSMFQVRQTYEGMMEGYPNPRVNDELIAAARRNFLGQKARFIHVVPPVRQRKAVAGRPADHEVLPELHCEALVSSWELGEMGSRLRVSWWQDEAAAALSVVEQVKRALVGVDWRESAESLDEF